MNEKIHLPKEERIQFSMHSTDHIPKMAGAVWKYYSKGCILTYPDSLPDRCTLIVDWDFRLLAEILGTCTGGSSNGTAQSLMQLMETLQNHRENPLCPMPAFPSSQQLYPKCSCASRQKWKFNIRMVHAWDETRGSSQVDTSVLEWPDHWKYLFPVNMWKQKISLSVRLVLWIY